MDLTKKPARRRTCAGRHKFVQAGLLSNVRSKENRPPLIEGDLIEMPALPMTSLLSDGDMIEKGRKSASGGRRLRIGCDGRRRILMADSTGGGYVRISTQIHRKIKLYKEKQK